MSYDIGEYNGRPSALNIMSTQHSPPEDEVQALQTLSPRRSALCTLAQMPIEACPAPDQTQQPAPGPHLSGAAPMAQACLPMVKLRAWARIEHGMALRRLWQDHVRSGCSGSGRSGFPASRPARIPLNCRRAAEFGGSTRFDTDLVGCLHIVDSRTCRTDASSYG